MSIYSALSFDPPIISYSALHQMRKTVPKSDYVATMQDLHRLVREESKKVNETWSSQRSSLIAKTIHSLRSHLGPFLATPLRSDDDEIQRHLTDALLQFSDQVAPADQLGAVTTIEGKIIWDDNPPASLKKLVTAGKKYLSDLKFEVGKNRCDIFESNFIIEGGLNLDVIEHIVRDRIGIYTPVHGKHIKEFDSYAYAAHNLIHAFGGQSIAESILEAALFFSKGETRYAPFRNGAIELLQVIEDQLQLPHISLWQRKLGLGVGSEFILRFRYREKSVLPEVVSLITAFAAKPFVRDAMLESGHLLLKELMPIAV